MSGRRPTFHDLNFSYGSSIAPPRGPTSRQTNTTSSPSSSGTSSKNSTNSATSLQRTPPSLPRSSSDRSSLTSQSSHVLHFKDRFRDLQRNDPQNSQARAGTVKSPGSDNKTSSGAKTVETTSSDDDDDDEDSDSDDDGLWMGGRTSKRTVHDPKNKGKSDENSMGSK